MLDKSSMASFREARIRFLESDFQIIEPGSYVRCAVTGDPIPVDELKYWNFERQEAYRDAWASLEAEQNAKKGG